MKRFVACFLFIFLLFSPGAIAQLIRGRLKTNSGKPVAHVSVVLKNNEGLILKYTSSNEHGNFQMAVSDTAKLSGLVLECTHLSFKKLQTPLLEKIYNYELVMQEEFNTLPEVKVTNKPVITNNGDTLSYN